MNKRIISTAILALAFALVVSAWSDKGKTKPEDSNPADQFEKRHDTAILLVTFGSTSPSTKATYAQIKEVFRQAFPNTDLYYSFTSRIIINRLKARGETYIRPSLWLESFLKKKYKNVYVQSLHVIPGEEYTLLRDANIKKEYNKQLFDLKEDQHIMEYQDCNYAVLGDPLLSDDTSIERVAKCLIDLYAKELKAGEVVAFMGHGNTEESYRFANEKYDVLEKMMQEYATKQYGNGRVFVATVDYHGKQFGDYLAEAIEQCGAKEKIINLHPLMTIAGDHANNDMAGDRTEKNGQPIPMEERSWKLQLQNMGWVVKPTLKGLGDYPEINYIYLEHLKVAIANADKE